jgi:hypothetical protein
MKILNESFVVEMVLYRNMHGITREKDELKEEKEVKK